MLSGACPKYTQVCLETKSPTWRDRLGQDSVSRAIYAVAVFHYPETPERVIHPTYKANPVQLLPEGVAVSHLDYT